MGDGLWPSAFQAYVKNITPRMDWNVKIILLVLAALVGVQGRGVVEVQEDLPLCYSSPAADPSEGEWTKCEGGIAESPLDLDEWPPRDDLPTITHYTESCDDQWAAEHNAAEIRPYWRWAPDHCRLEELDAAKFCQAMEGRKGVLLVGDSLTREFSITVASVLRARLISTGSRGPDIWLACDGALNVQFYRNDFLDLGTEFFGEGLCQKGRMDRCFVFSEDSILEGSDVVVVNAGAHIPPGGMSEFEANMRAASEKLTSSMERLHGNNATLIVRNSSPGHAGCQTKMFDAPVSQSTASTLVSGGPEDYHWTEFDKRNKVLEDNFGSAAGWKLLDVYSPTVLRADAHRGGIDCLHYCMPGPVDHWAVLLYNMLLAESLGDTH